MRYRLATASHELQKRGVERVANTLTRNIGRRLQRIDDYEYRLKQTVRSSIDKAKRPRDTATSKTACDDETSAFNWNAVKVEWNRPARPSRRPCNRVSPEDGRCSKYPPRP